MLSSLKALRGFGLLIIGFVVAATFNAVPAQAATGINKQLSFQGKVVNASGVNLADGTYDMEFKIYQDGNSSGSGSTLKWTEDYLVSGSTGMPSTGGVTITSGTFNVSLGSICALSGGTCGAKTNAGVDFNQDTLWLSFQVGNTSSCTVTSSATSFNTGCSGDGEMTPFIRLTAVPQAMNAEKVGGLTASQLVQLTPSGTQSGSIAVDGNIKTTTGQVQANTYDAASSGALTVGSSNATSISLAKNTNVNAAATFTVLGANGLLLGSTTAAGGIVFNDGTSNSRAVTLFASAIGATGSYTLALPTSGTSGTNCLQSTSGSTTTVTVLQWGSCGSGGVTWPLAHTGTENFQPNSIANNALGLTNNASAVNGLTITGTASGTDPILGSSAGISLQPTSGIVALNRASTNNELRVYENSATPTNYATITFSGGAAVYGSSNGTVQLGSTSGTVTIPLTNINDNFTFSKTYTPSTTYSSSHNEFSIQRVLTGGANIINGNVADIEDLSTGTNASSAPNVLYVNQSNATFGGNLILAQVGGSTDKFKVDVAGNVNIAGSYKVGGTSGVSQVCTGGQTYQATTISGGIATAGACAATGVTDLQGAYGGSGSPATITTTATGKTILFKAGSTFDSASLFQVQSAASVAVLSVDTSGLKLQVGSATTDSNAVLLVLDSYDQTTDPTGTNGGLYYNTSSNKFRCYQNSTWTDCVSFGNVTKSADQSATRSSTTFQDDTELAFSVDASTTYVFNAYIPVDDSNTSADLKYTFTVPTGASITAFATTYSTATANIVCNIIASAQSCATTVNNAANFINIQGFLRTGVTSGSLQFRFAQNTSTNADFPVVKAGATLQWHRQ